MAQPPAYQAVATQLRDKILDGTYQPGSRLPTELELVRQFAVSRNTIRLALDRLAASNMVRRRRGAGTFVTDGTGISHTLGSLLSVTELIANLGLQPGLHDVSLQVDPAPPAECGGFFAAEIVWCLHRIRTASGTPFAIMDSWLPDRIGRQLSVARIKQVQSLYLLMKEDCGIDVSEATESIHAEVADARKAAAFASPAGSPLLLMHRWTYDRSGQPVEYARSWARGDTYRYVVKLRR
jgi:GntR family transcriptional regulator